MEYIHTSAQDGKILTDLDMQQSLIIGDTQMIKLLILDDERPRHEALRYQLKDLDFPVQVQSTYLAYQTIKFLETEKYDFLLLDHDLKCGETGMKVIDYLVDQEPDPNMNIICHSGNNHEAIKMANRLSSEYSSVATVFFYTMLANIRLYIRP